MADTRASTEIGKTHPVVDRVNPEQFVVRECEPCVLRPMRATWSTKRKIAGEPAAGLNNSRRCDRVKDDADFDALALVLQLQNAEDRFVECVVSLDDIVVDVIHGRVDGNARHEIGVTQQPPKPWRPRC